MTAAYRPIPTEMNLTYPSIWWGWCC